MEQDGAVKVIAGITSLDELGSVVDLSEAKRFVRDHMPNATPKDDGFSAHIVV